MKRRETAAELTAHLNAQRAADDPPDWTAAPRTSAPRPEAITTPWGARYVREPSGLYRSRPDERPRSWPALVDLLDRQADRTRWRITIAGTAFRPVGPTRLALIAPDPAGGWRAGHAAVALTARDGMWLTRRVEQVAARAAIDAWITARSPELARRVSVREATERLDGTRLDGSPLPLPVTAGRHPARPGSPPTAPPAQESLW